MRVWLDCEFTSIDDPAMLSVGMVSDDGRECYIELLDDELERRSSNFVRQQVLPLLGRLGGARVESYHDLCWRLTAYLRALAGSVELCYDYKTDRELVQHALERSPHWSELGVTWRNVSIETCSDNAQEAMDAMFVAAEHAGLGRHHALVDARALRMAHLLSGND